MEADAKIHGQILEGAQESIMIRGRIVAVRGIEDTRRTHPTEFSNPVISALIN